MSDVGKTERITQNRVIRLFYEELGYHYLGNWTDRPNGQRRGQCAGRYLCDFGVTRRVDGDIGRFDRGVERRVCGFTT